MSSNRLSLVEEAADISSTSSKDIASFSKRTSLVTQQRLEVVRTSAKDQSKQEKLKNVRELKFSSLGVLGRDEEIQQLQQAFQRCCGSAPCNSDIVEGGESSSRPSLPRRELVLISGVSGVGKSKLAMTALQRPISKANGFMAQCKFDNTNREEPYSGFQAIWSDLLLKYEGFQEKIPHVLDSVELSLLSKIIPSLVLAVQPPNQSPSSNGGGQETKNDDYLVPPISSSASSTKILELQDFLKLTFRKLFGALLEHMKPSPLVILFDDLQWADQESLELLKSLLLRQDDDSIRRLLFVGCYRSNEVVETHMLAQWIRTIQNEKDAVDLFALTEIPLGSLSQEAATSILAAVLSIDDTSSSQKDDLVLLSQLCHKRTHGNAFFLLSYLRMLQEETLLTFHLGAMTWKWNLPDVETKTAATVNVVTLLQDKMHRIIHNTEAKRFLQLAACLGNKFEKKTLELVWTKTAITTAAASITHPNDTSNGSTSNASSLDFHTLLELCIQECFFEQVETNTSFCRWAHDKVQEAAIDLSSKSSFSAFQHKVGTILLEEWDLKTVENQIFVLCNLLNQSSETVSKQTAEMNLRASQKAKSFSAFESAASHATKGIGYLPEDCCWTRHKVLTVGLYSVHAEAEFKLGNINAAEQSCASIIQQSHLSTAEKSRAYIVLIQLRTNTEKRHKEAFAICMDVLSQLGCDFPRNFAIKSFLGLRAILKLRKLDLNQEVSTLPTMEDSNRALAMEVMDIAAGLTQVTNDVFLHVLLSMRIIEWTMKYGISDESPSALAGIGTMVSVIFADYKVASNYAQIALSLNEKTPTRKNESTTRIFSYVFCLAFQKPVVTFLEPLAGGYKLGMEVGITEMAMFNICNYLLIEAFCGKSLKIAEQDCSIYVPQMKALYMQEAYDVSAPLWEAVRNLAGMTRNTTKLEGKNMDGGSLDVSARILPTTQSFLYAYFGEYEAGAKQAIRLGKKYMRDISINGIVFAFVYFFQGISLYAMVRRGGRNRTYRKHALRVRRGIKVLVQKGNPNSVHHLKILDAEHEAAFGKRGRAYKLYQEGITLAARGGFIHDVALANERYAAFLLEADDTEEARYRFEQSLEYYSEWGATRKVEELGQKIQSLFSS